MSQFNLENKRHIHGISLISSSICNLTCSFCYLHKNNAYRKYNVEVQEAWLDGSYIDNVLNTLLKLNSDPQELKEIQLWGGETLLSIKNITPNLEKIYKYFPNVNLWRISTNWMINVNDFFNFLVELDTQARVDEVEFKVQCSIDGPEGIYTETGHNGKWDIYHKNFATFFNLVNNHKFNKIHIEISINATVGKEIYLKQFINKDNIVAYVKYMREFTQFLSNHCINRSIDIMQEYVFPGYALPYSSTKEEGLKLATILKLWDEVRAEYFDDLHPSSGLQYGIGELCRPKGLIEPNIECSELKYTLTINPDGTVVECSGAFMDHQEEYQEELAKENNSSELVAAKFRTAVSKNPINASDKELETYDWYVANGYKGTKATFMHLMISVCNELALSGQIDYKYYNNPDLLIKHLSVLSSITSCTRENIKDTGIAYLTSPSCFRRFLNGAVEYAYDMKKIDMQDMMQAELQNKSNKRNNERMCNCER